MEQQKRYSPPKDGTFLVLSPAQISNLDLLCLIKRSHLHTEIIAQQPIPVK